MILRLVSSVHFPAQSDLSGVYGKTSHATEFATHWRDFALLVREPTLVGCTSISEAGSSLESILEQIRQSGKLQEIRKQIKESGLNLSATDSEMWTALHWAVEMGRLDLVPLLLDAQPILLHMKTKEGLSAINIAAWTGNTKMVELLLDQGAEIDDRTKWGETPLHHAVTFGYVDVAEFLLERGADPSASDKLKRTPSDIVRQRGSEGMKKLFEREKVMGDSN